MPMLISDSPSVYSFCDSTIIGNMVFTRKTMFRISNLLFTLIQIVFIYLHIYIFFLQVFGSENEPFPFLMVNRGSKVFLFQLEIEEKVNLSR